MCDMSDQGEMTLRENLKLGLGAVVYMVCVLTE